MCWCEISNEILCRQVIVLLSAIFCISVHIGVDIVDVYGYQMKCGMCVGVVC